MYKLIEKQTDKRLVAWRNLRQHLETSTRPFEDTIEFAKNFAKELKGGETIGLIGDLGSGKTTLGNKLKQKYKNKEVLPNTLLDKGSVIDIVVSKMVSNSDTTALQNMRNGVEQKIQEDEF
jgi:ABC-type glutathione transport system ATPase component